MRLPRFIVGAIAGLSMALPTLALAAEKAAEGAEKKSQMPQLDPSSYASQLFWLTLTFVVFLLIVWRIALPRIVRVLEDRREKLDRDLARAAELRDEAEKVLAEYEKLAAEGRASAQALIREAADAAAAHASAEHAKLSEKLEKQIANSETRIAKARDDAMGEVGQVAGEIAKAAVERLIGVKVTDAVADGAAKKAAKELGGS